MSLAHSDVQLAGALEAGPGSVTTSELIDVDPLYAPGTLQPRWGSPVIDRHPGQPSQDLDLLGKLRLMGARQDMGAFEFDPADTPAPPSADALAAADGETAPLAPLTPQPPLVGPSGGPTDAALLAELKRTLAARRGRTYTHRWLVAGALTVEWRAGRRVVARARLVREGRRRDAAREGPPQRAPARPPIAHLRDCSVHRHRAGRAARLPPPRPPSKGPLVMLRTALLALPAVVAAAAFAAPASASTLCVHKGTGCPAGTLDKGDDLQAAIESAEATFLGDVITVGPGTYVGPFEHDFGTPIDIVGSGVGVTVLTAPVTEDHVIFTEGANLANLTVRLPSVEDFTGIRASRTTTVSDVLVTGLAPPGGPRTGIALGGDANVLRTNVTLGQDEDVGVATVSPNGTHHITSPC